MKTIDYSFEQIQSVRLTDQVRLKNRLRSLRAKKNQPNAHKAYHLWHEELLHAQQFYQQLCDRKIDIGYPESLPVSGAIEKILELFKQHQIIIVAGETGSGKTTQLPKMCLSQGRGRLGQIAHTQPRRLAAISVAQRIAEEMNTPLGDLVGYKIRFQDHTSEHCMLKLMTDGMLLAEIQRDRLMLQYDTIIIDEAHERSLNIDFLLGYIKRILPKRPDLKVIVTSATINTERFSLFFNQAPVVEVSGKLWPVEIRYQQNDEDEENEADSEDAYPPLLQAIEELCNEGSGDILVFFSGEKEIREAMDLIQGHFSEQMLCLPLYAQLSAKRQHLIFHPQQKRKIILATNIAETSVTIPGIRYVIDTGTARISRYSVKNKIQMLPIEAISQASAKQRSGRCGRTSNGIAIRLYSEQDFTNRAEFTDAEILRTNLAQVILQMQSLGLGSMHDFDFIDAPKHKNINDGYHQLIQLHAIEKIANDVYQLTSTGRQLAHLPIDPRLGRVLLEANKQGVLSELIVICALMSAQDPRENPAEFREQARQAHQDYLDPRSDFITILNIWHDYHQQAQIFSQNQLRKYCLKRFISFKRMREWRDIASQLRLQLLDIKIKANALFNPDLANKEANYASIHRALLSGFFDFIAYKHEKNEYLACRNLKLMIHPQSGLRKKSPQWILACEIVKTSQVFSRKVGFIEAGWVIEQAAHLLKHHYYEPSWDNKSGKVMAKDKISLLGLVIEPAKRVNYSQIDSKLSHEIFINEALISGRYTDFRRKTPEFLKKNTTFIEKLQTLEHQSRSTQIVPSDQDLYDFYAGKIEQQLCTRSSFENWRKKIASDLLLFEHSQLLCQTQDEQHQQQYPEQIMLDGFSYKLEYHFRPNHPLDGVTVNIPIEHLNLLEDKVFSRLVPGLIREKVTLMFRALAKPIRKTLIPIPDRVTEFLESAVFNDHNLDLELAFIQFIRSKNHQVIADNCLQNLQMPVHLQMNYRLIVNKQELDSCRNLTALQDKWRSKVENKVRKMAQKQSSTSIEQENLNDWPDTQDIPNEIKLKNSEILLYPALQDNINSVSLKLFDNPFQAQHMMQQGLLRLYDIKGRKSFEQSLKIQDIRGQWQKHSIGLSRLLAHFQVKQNEKQLVKQLSMQLCRRLFEANNCQLYSHSEFSQRLELNRANYYPELKKLLGLLDNILCQYQLLNKLIEKQQNFSLLHLHQDIKQQLSRLFSAHFFATTPAVWLDRFPIYLQAIVKRLENNPLTQQKKDKILQDEINQLEEQFYRALEKCRKDQHYWHNYTKSCEYRWLLEELRVSFFAQQLKTCKTVSVKRLEKIYQQLPLE